MGLTVASPAAASASANPDPEFWHGRRVLLTGHTGFKGAWLALWLQELGARVTGFALEPSTQPSMFELARVGEGMRSLTGDVRDLDALRDAFAVCQPEFVVHMAAQSLVLRSYREPVVTYATNVIGTVHVLEAMRLQGGVRACLIVTSDKCYENRETQRAYAESDPMGGKDPYSSSKGCAELVTAAYRNSFFAGNDAPAAVASARSGNVVGGGDFSEDRLVPDMMRAFLAKSAVHVRNPEAVRPWQHVLDPLRGYLLLCERLARDGAAYAESWNFGPADEDSVPVRNVVDRLLRHWPKGEAILAKTPIGPREAGLLKLDCSKASVRLGWRPRWNLERCLVETARWFKSMEAGGDLRVISLTQLHDYTDTDAT
jgi:CDP-glucose 4,6-dehydratase